MTDHFNMNRRKPWNGTNINSADDAAVVFPGQYPALKETALKISRMLSSIINGKGQVPAIQHDTVLPARDSVLPSEYRNRHLILLGNINTNRALLTPYARYYCAADALYPGNGGWVIRTMVNPLGTGYDMILAGGSNEDGILTAGERLITLIQNCGSVIPFTLEVSLEEELAERLHSWAETPLNAPFPGDIDSLLISSGSYAVNFAWTGDRKFGEYGAECLRRVNARMDTSYGDRHYRMERVIRGLPWLIAGGFLSSEEIHRTDQLLLGMQLGSEDAWWRKKDGSLPLGHRHHAKGTHEFLLISRYLREQSNPNDNVVKITDRWIRECQIFLDALASAGHDDQDDETTLNTIGTLFWYALAEERYEFFRSGQALRTAKRAIALHDNMNTAAGPGGYAESLLSGMYLQQESLTPVAASAFWYKEGELKWLLKNFPKLDPPARGGFWAFSPIFMHKFDSGPEIRSEKPRGMSGLHMFSPAPYQISLCSNPPEHIEPLGHFTDAPETWLYAAGIARHNQNRKGCFDKIVYRRGFNYTDPYLLLQGYQGGFRWQGHMQAANCIIRFSQGGHIFLLQNTRQHSPCFKNGIMVSNGCNTEPVPPFAQYCSLTENSTAAFSSTSLSPYYGTNWKRKLFYLKRGNGLFITADIVEALAEGPVNCVCTWRTPIFAVLKNKTWRTDQGNYRFRLTWDDNAALLNEEERELGAANPFVLHQFKQKFLQKGESVDYVNLFYADLRDKQEEYSIKTFSQGSLIIGPENYRGWCGFKSGNIFPGMVFHGEGIFIDEESISIGGCTSFKSGNLMAESSNPLAVYVSLKDSWIRINTDAAADTPAAVIITVSGNKIEEKIAPGRIVTKKLPSRDSRVISRLIREGLRELDSRKLSSAESATAENPPAPLYRCDPLKKIPYRIRELTVYTNPPPADGLPEQLIDTVPNEFRETWRQWPEDHHKYNIKIDLLTEKQVSDIRILGDSKNGPLLRTYHPLPENISVITQDSSGNKKEAEWKGKSDTPSLRYRGYTDVLETSRYTTGNPVKEINITVNREGRPLVLQEVEVYGGVTAPPVRHMFSTELFQDSGFFVLIVDDSPALTILDKKGNIFLRYDLPGIVYAAECLDLSGNGIKSICLGMAGGEMLVLSPEGNVIHSSNLSDAFESLGETLIGWMHTPFSFALWQRSSDGQGAIAAGGYGALLYLDTDFQPLGHSFVDGSWVTDVLTGPPGSGHSLDIWTRTGWNHGISRYRGLEGFSSSGDYYELGGDRQRMFRNIQRVIPFVNGRTRLFRWVKIDTANMLLAAAENGFGLISPETDEFVWKQEGWSAVSCAALCRNTEGNSVISLGDAAGFTADFGIESGDPLNRLSLDFPVIGIYDNISDRIYVTKKSIYRVDHSLMAQDKYSCTILDSASLGGNKLVLLTNDGVLQIVRI